MNFLAHFHLAWPDEGLIVGGLEGDFFKGGLPGSLPADIAAGVRLHRAIDAYTDQHPTVVQLRSEFPSQLRRYAGILIDLAFDHYLTLGWAQYSKVPLRQFNDAVYQLLLARQQQLSPGSQTMLTRLVDYDILSAYVDWEAVPATAARIGERLSRGNPIANVGPQLAPLKQHFSEAFTEFYPQLMAFCTAQRSDSKPGC